MTSTLGAEVEFLKFIINFTSGTGNVDWWWKSQSMDLNVFDVIGSWLLVYVGN